MDYLDNEFDEDVRLYLYSFAANEELDYTEDEILDLICWNVAYYRFIALLEKEIKTKQEADEREKRILARNAAREIQLKKIEEEKKRTMKETIFI